MASNKVGSRGKAIGFLKKLYKGRRGLGERLQKSGMKVAEVTGKARWQKKND